MIVAVDFDGTMALHRYPKIGDPVPYALETVRELIKHEHQIVLYTCRTGQELQDAVEWLASHGIELFGVNTLPDNLANTSKPFASIYIDDAAAGCPLLYEDLTSDRMYVDWKWIRIILTERGFFA